MRNERVELLNLVNRVNDLEAKSAFQEDSVNQLNAVIIQQQQQMDHLNIVINALRMELQSANLEETLDISTEDEKPPHY